MQASGGTGGVQLCFGVWSALRLTFRPDGFEFINAPTRDAIRRHGIDFPSYADDMQLYTAMSPDDTQPIDDFLNCILHTNSKITAFIPLVFKH